MSLENVETFYPLSPLQQGLLFHSLYLPASDVGLQGVSGRIQSRLDQAAFEAAWRQTMRRHPVLRTSFVWDGVKEPVQVVHRNVEVPIEWQDWSGRPSSQQEEQLEALLQAGSKHGFNLQRPPLMRLTVVRLAEDVYHFFWSYHHLLLDGWSLGLVLREVMEFYESHRQGLQPALPPVRPYGDYLLWLRRQEPEQAEAFWRHALAGFRDPTPVGRRRTGIADYRELSTHLTANTTAALQAFARRNQLTLNTLVQGAWGLLLAHWSGREDVVFGTTVTGRPADLAGIESIAGLFINHVPVRPPAPADGEVFPHWLKRLQAGQAAARQHDHVSPAQIQEWSEVPRHSRLYESLVVFENYPVEAVVREQFRNLQISRMRGRIRTSYTLTMAAVPGSELMLQLVHDNNRLDTGMAGALLQGLSAVLREAAADPARRPSELVQLVERPERQQSPPAGMRDSPDPLEEPLDLIELELIRLLEQSLDIRPVRRTDHLIDLAGDSLQALALLARLREHFGPGLPLFSLLQSPTVGDLARRLRTDREAGTWSPLVTLQPKGRRRPFFCVHPAGGTVLSFARLAQHLGPDQPFHALQASGLQGEEETALSIEELASRYVAAVRTAQPEGPYLLGGWSMGGTVAFEMARQLRGENVALLALFDSYPPGAFRQEMAADADTRFLTLFLWTTSMYSGKEPRASARDLERIEAGSRLDFVLEEIRHSGAWPEGVSAAEARRFFKLWQNHYRSLQNYSPPPGYSGGLTLFRATGKPPQPLLDLERTSAILVPADWQRLVAGPVEILEVPGNHYTLFNEPQVRMLAEQLRPFLDASSGV